MASYSLHHFLAKIGEPIWYAVGVYGCPEGTNKFQTLEFMTRLRSFCSLLMVLLDNFNEIMFEMKERRSLSERKSDGEI